MIEVKLSPADLLEAERLGHVSWAAVLARPHRTGGKNSLQNQILARLGEMTVARHFGIRHPFEGLDRWPLEAPDGTDLTDKDGKRWGVRCRRESWHDLNIRIKDVAPQILVLGHMPPRMFIVGWCDPAEGRTVGKLMHNPYADGGTGGGDPRWWAVSKSDLHPLPEDEACWVIDPQMPGHHPWYELLLRHNPRIWD